MIKKSIIAATLLLILHGFLVKYKPKWSFPQNQWQRNIIKTQHFIYDDFPSVNNLLIGSSLSDRLIMDSLPDIYNLSYNGGSVFDGLEVLEKAKIYPQRVFLETNVITRLGNNNFINSVYNPILFGAKKALPSLREEYQPMGLINNKLTINIVRKTIQKLKPFRQSDDSYFASHVFKKMLAMHIKNDTLDYPLIEKSVKALKKYINKLEKNNVEIIFFEMPIDPYLAQLPRTQIIRKILMENYSPDKYTYITLPDCSLYKTTDGKHLTPESAKRFSSELRKKISPFLLK